MSSRVITTCDRCKRETFNPHEFNAAYFRQDNQYKGCWDLCKDCAAAVVAFIGNPNLIVTAQ